MKRLLTYFSVLLLFLACSKDAVTPAPQPKPKFTITVAAGEGGSVSSTGGSYEQGSTVSVTATASSGYRFTGWSNGETSATLNITVTGNLSVTALFEKIAYSVDISGAVSKGAFLTGSTLTFYELNNSLSQTGKSYNTDITDNFGSYSLSVEELTEDYARVVGEGFYWNEVTNTNTEEKLSLNAISEVKEGININVLTHLEYQRVIELVKNQGKSFSDAKNQALTETLSSLGIETTTDYGTSEQFNFKEGDEKSKILVVASAIIQAKRSSAEVTELITTVANDLKDNGNIDDTEVKTDIAVQLAKINLSEVASNIYERYKEENPELTQDNFISDYLEIAKSEYQEFLPDADGDGVQDDLDLCPDTPEGEEADANGCGKTQKQYQLTTTVEGSGSISEEVIEQPTASYDYGTTVRLTANPINGWEFKEWKGDITSTENPIDVTVVEEVVVTAVFVKKQFTITTSIEGEGTVAASPEAEAYDYQSTVELTATPSEGWVFSEWKGSTNSTDNPLSISMNDNKEITAVFKRKQYELTVTVQGEGAVAEEIVTEPSQYDNGTAVKLTATAAEGWEFTGWSGDLEGTENPTNITIDKAKSVTATFEKADSDGDGVVDLEDLCPETPEGATVNDNGCHDIIYVAENGVTIKARETAIIGDTQAIDDVEYTVVDETMLREMVANNEDVTNIVTSGITNLSGLFNGNQTFNQDISSWDTSSVTTFSNMFHKATIFNQDLSNWDVSNATDFTLMFFDTHNFNSDIANWDVSSGITFAGMFSGTQKFNVDISNWDVSNATNMGGMFSNTLAFNQDIGNWDVSSVTNMADMFHNSIFNYPLNNWDVSNVTDMSTMFWSAQYNHPLNNWDVSNVLTMKGMFDKAANFNQNINNWDVSKVIDMSIMFAYSKMNEPLDKWDVSSVVNMDGMFAYNNSFNQDISMWCVTGFETEPQGFNSPSNLIDPKNSPVWGQCGEIYLDDNGVTIKARDNAVVGESYKLTNDGDSYVIVGSKEDIGNRIQEGEDPSRMVTTRVLKMHELFLFNSGFVADLSSWDVSNVTHFNRMFEDAEIFESDLSNWDTSSAVNLSDMFRDARLFQSDLSNWNVSKVTDMKRMFAQTKAFNSDLDQWNVSNVVNMERMFYDADSFNGEISSWNVTSVTNMSGMFGETDLFNKDIGNWNMESVVTTNDMFQSATKFNQPLNEWNVSNVIQMAGMFDNATSFNQNISGWDTSSVQNMQAMFKQSGFNQDIGSWDVSSVTNMNYMFQGNTGFSQDLSDWCVTNVAMKPESFDDNSGLTDENLPIWGQCGEIYLDDNGVTIKARDNAVAGESYKLTNGGDSYKVVDETMLREMVTNNEDVTKVVTTLVSNMSLLFKDKTTFNQNISSWDVSNVTNMNGMFYGSTYMDFNQDIGSWDVGKVTNMSAMFVRNNKFNQDIGDWDVGAVTTMNGMFLQASIFNQDISAWDVSKVTDMNTMFQDAWDFNQDIGSWDVSNVTDMNRMFNQALSFNQNLNAWNVSNVEDMQFMFANNTRVFNSPLNNWDVSSVKNMSGMFQLATKFNQPLNEWNVSNVIQMAGMFDNATSFNQNISGWDTSSVQNMQAMFKQSGFNQDIGSWKVSSVTNMKYMFQGNTGFSQDLSDWCVTNVAMKPESFDDNSGLTNEQLPIWGTCDKDMDGVRDNIDLDDQNYFIRYDKDNNDLNDDCDPNYSESGRTKIVLEIKSIRTAGTSTGRIYLHADVFDGELALDFETNSNGWYHAINTGRNEWIEYYGSDVVYKEFGAKVVAYLNEFDNGINTKEEFKLFFDGNYSDSDKNFYPLGSLSCLSIEIEPNHISGGSGGGGAGSTGS